MGIQHARNRGAMSKTIDLDELERIAKAASEPSGQWSVYRCNYADDGQACGIIDDGSNLFCQDGSRDECHHLIPQSDAAHIAANDPTTTLALIARIRELEAERDAARTAIAGIFDAIDGGMLDMVHGDMHREYDGGPDYFVPGECPQDDTCECEIRRRLQDAQDAVPNICAAVDAYRRSRKP